MRKITCVIILIIGTLGCKKPYNPAATTVNYNYLVVEGVINTQDSTIITLSRTVNITSVTTNNPELKAQVSIESNQNNNYPLIEKGNGKYAAPSFNLSNGNQYRLRVKTSGGNEYLSDFVQAKASPPIDSITYQFMGKAVNFYAYTQDATNNTKYYRWAYTETYLYLSPVASDYKYVNGNVVTLSPANEITTCYISDTSSTIILNSTASLSRDIVNKMPVTQVPLTLNKLAIKYSINVIQYALTPDAYNYYLNLKKNTETIGTIFDAQPSPFAGNIHCLTNASQPVIGYITAGSTAQVRIFVDRSMLPVANIGSTPGGCAIGTADWTGGFGLIPGFIKFGDDTPVSAVKRGYDAKTKDSTFSVQFAASTCVDCTLMGTNKKPAYWQQNSI